MHRVFRVGLTIILPVIVLLAMALPLFVPHRMHAQNEEQPSSSPPRPHLLYAEQGEPAHPTDYQGVVTIDVTLPNVITASDDIVYTYSYKNTGTTAAQNVEIEVIWVNFALEYSSNADVWQYCDNHCQVVADSVVGNPVHVVEDVSSNGVGRFSVGTLAAGQAGSFNVRLRSTHHSYPKSDQSIVRPSGSARLFINGADASTSEVTKNTMTMGPVFVLSKKRETGKVFPLRDVDFTITVGNATGSKDTENGDMRPDATDATNIIVEDTFPEGGDFVRADGNYTVDAEKKKVTWTIAGPLAPGKTHDVHVTYKKLDEKVTCGSITNKTYTVTSDEMPFKDEDSTTRYTVAGAAVSGEIANAVEIQSVTANPVSMPYGDPSMVSVVVRNYFDQAIYGAEVSLVLPSNVSYVAASSEPVNVPAEGTMGGTVKWVIDLDAASLASPLDKTLNVQVAGGFEAKGSAATASIVLPNTVPSACITPRTGNSINLTPRLTYEKKREGTGYVARDELVTYVIALTNNSTTNVENIAVTDIVPGNTNAACFEYIKGATLGDTPIEPTSVDNGGCGSLQWNGLQVPAKTTLNLRYQMRVDGSSYVEYCNQATVTLLNEAVTKKTDKVCVKMNPFIEVKKSVSNATPNANEAVIFTLQLTNHENTPYKVALYDKLDKFTFVQHANGYAEPSLGENNTLTWPLVTVQPGETIESAFLARIEGNCPANTTYTNEVLFLNEEYDIIGIIQPVPKVSVGVKYTRPPECDPTPTPKPTAGATATPTNTPTPKPAEAVVSYSKIANRSEASLKDVVVYTIQVQNVNREVPVTDVVVDDLLPVGFSFQSLDDSSTYNVRPLLETTENNQVRLLWNIPVIEPGQPLKIAYIARTGDVVGQYSSSVTVDVPDAWHASVSNSNEVKTIVRPLATLAPSFNTSSNCQEQGTELLYKLVLLNTNIHSYVDTTAVVTLPIGLQYVGIVTGTTPIPHKTVFASGETRLEWNKLTIPKPSGNTFAQLALDVNVVVGKTWGSLVTRAYAESPDGLIPRKENSTDTDSTVNVCPPPAPSMGKVGSGGDTISYEGGIIPYQIQLVNPSNMEINNVTIEDVLPQKTTYVQMTVGAEPVYDTERNMLRWSDLTVPAGDETEHGSLTLKYELSFPWTLPGVVYTNTAVISSTIVFSPTTDAYMFTAKVEDPPKDETVLTEKLYLPVIQTGTAKQ